MKARNRIKPLLTLCCALLLVAAGVFGTLAYLTGTDTVNNTFTVAVRGDVAEQYGLETTSDLAGAAGELTFGGNPDYLEREDGFPTLCKTYGLDFRNVVDIDIGLKYQALAGGDIDVTNAFTTDAQLANPDTDLVTLEDDKHLQVNYFCSTVVRRDALEKFPGLE